MVRCVGAASVALCAIVVGTVACAAPVPPSPNAPSPANTPRFERTPAAGRPNLDEFGWGHLSLVFDDPGTLSGFVARAGLLSGDNIVEVDITFATPLGPAPKLVKALPFISWPVNGRVAYGYFDGVGARLQLLDLQRGTDEPVASVPEVIHAAAVGPDGSVFFMVLDRESRDEVGTFTVRPGGDPVLVIPPREINPAPTDGSALYVTPGGDHLLIHDCDANACTLRQYETATGTHLAEVRTAHFGLMGLSSLAAVAPSTCLEGCPAVAYELPGLRGHEFGSLCGPARGIVVGRTVGVTTSAAGDCAGGAGSLVTHLLSGDKQDVPDPHLAELQLVEQNQFDVTELPEGWALVATNATLSGDSQAALVNVVTGESISVDLGD